LTAKKIVKKPERVEALLFIMALCLSVYAAIEYRIRQKLLSSLGQLFNITRSQADTDSVYKIDSLPNKGILLKNSLLRMLRLSHVFSIL